MNPNIKAVSETLSPEGICSIIVRTDAKNAADVIAWATVRGVGVKVVRFTPDAPPVNWEHSNMENFDMLSPQILKPSDDESALCFFCSDTCEDGNGNPCRA